ncbi:pimeloyl-ACP methyl ester carboxylesterase [Catenuloplanes nepalensis]|uniref:Pimeloyl-ACP methyl ester carboxylesterase n=1 Tax=Catenuloplanes nepalensis TaxID=587533 RepID=A0ABT9MTR4_9ACTN|nr:alpha/beta fold hydrolase [Catenuloplanes nepalensis]MDP9794840.1 pimeloyl-ACP methyl ester carboxylesterase [Catenuloplanes nepalensis]
MQTDIRLWSAERGAGAPTLLIMGTAAQSVGWPEPLVDRLVEGGRRVILFDHRDTGLSECRDFAAHPYSIDDLALDCLAVLDAHGVGAAHLAGASLGGAIGQWLAVHRPDRVLSLTAIMTSPMGNDPGPAWARAFAGAPPLDGELPAPSPQFLRYVTSPERDPLGTQRVLHGDGLPFDEEAARDYVRRSAERAVHPEAAANHDLAGRRWTAARRAPLGTITAPTLVIHGSADPLFPPAHGEALAAAVPGARLTVIDGMGHGFFSPGLPERVADLILG